MAAKNAASGNAAKALIPARMSSVFLTVVFSSVARSLSASKTRYSALGMVTLSRTILGFLSFCGLLAVAATGALLFTAAVVAGAAVALGGAAVLAVVAAVRAEGAFARGADVRGVVFLATVLRGLAGFAADGVVVWVVMVVSYTGR